jgi:Domain of unknown function (DUF4439)
VGRRSVLAAGGGLLGAGALAGLLGGCSDRRAAQPPGKTSATSPAARPGATADDRALTRARTTAAHLAVVAEQLAAARKDLAGLLAAVSADHRAHLAALGAPGAPTGSPSAAAPPSGSPTRSASSGGPDPTSMIDRERSGAQEALDDVVAISPGLAVLLARIAASRMAHADLLAGRTGVRMPGVLHTSPPARAPATARAVPTTADGALPAPTASLAAAAPLPSPSPSASGPATLGTPSTPTSGSASPPESATVQPALPQAARDALAALTAGEHAAVYAYGAVVARVNDRDRQRARQAWSWHVTRRDLLEDRLLAAGLRPPAAAPAYELGPLTSAVAAVTLAATVEDRIAVLTARTVAGTTGADRSDAAEALVAAARRAAAWRGRGEALPG